MAALRTLDGRATVLTEANLLERLTPESGEAFVEKLVADILEVRPRWTRESTEVIEAERRYREFVSKFQPGDDVFSFQTPRPSSGFVLVRVVENEPRIVTAMLTERP